MLNNSKKKTVTKNDDNSYSKKELADITKDMTDILTDKVEGAVFVIRRTKGTAACISGGIREMSRAEIKSHLEAALNDGHHNPLNQLLAMLANTEKKSAPAKKSVKKVTKKAVKRI